ncbi:hypothetical protein D9613_009730 [Agrocybe pediades]|uniref:Uncharacterized protein n=1 Tax=Agrocybe pediades TaxID=84607 RepID=A0A8H4QWP5_9AGAR|nr:hypothetical protein D9613_009730 [Agrocybe pediades]
MPNVNPIDDTDTQHIDYSGGWQVSTGGSSRQWESSVHYTIQPGATATFRFSGYQVWIFATTASGSGSNLLDVSIDGGPAVSISQQSNGDAQYNVQYFQSAVLADIAHQLVITNRGSAANGHPQPFMLDKLEFVTAAQTITWPPASAFQQPSNNGGSTSNPPGSNTGGSTTNPGSNNGGSTTNPGSSTGSGSSTGGPSSGSGTMSPGSGSSVQPGKSQGSSSSQSQNSSSSSTSSSSQSKSSTSSSSSSMSSSSSITSTSTNLPNGPLFASLPPGSGSTEQSTVTATSTVTAAADFAHSSSKNTPVGAIAGGVIGAVALIILVLFFLLWRRRRQAAFSVLEDGEKGRPRRSPLAPNPFVLDSTTPAQGPDTNAAPIYLSTHTPFSEKHIYRNNNQLQPVSTDSLMALNNSNNASNNNLLNSNNAGSSSDSATVANNASGGALSPLNLLLSPGSMYMRGDTLKSPSIDGSFDSAPPPSYTQKYHAVP